MEERIKVGDIVRHFKKETIDNGDINVYTYKVLNTTAREVDNYERVVVYEALYGLEDKGVKRGDVFVRKYDEFMSLVDTKKYPNIKQKYRFEVINDDRKDNIIERKYELLKDDTIKCHCRTLYRIKALRDFNDVKKGDLGGYIEKESNLSHFGTCWVYDNAKVLNGAEVSDDAKVCNNAIVFDCAKIYNRARVITCAKIYGYAKVCDDALAAGACTIRECASVGGHSDVVGFSDICSNAVVCGNASIENAKLSVFAYVTSNKDYFIMGPLKPTPLDKTLTGDFATLYLTEDKKIIFTDINFTIDTDNINMIINSAYDEEYKASCLDAIEYAKKRLLK